MRWQSIVLVFTLFLVLPTAAMADKITIVADEWCPYNCMPESDSPGFMIETAQAVFGKYGHEIDYKIMPWEEAVEAVGRGDFNAVVGASKIETPDFIFPIQPEGKVDEMFFTKKDSPWKYTDMDSLKKVKIGIIQGYSYGPELDDYFEENIDTPAVYVASGEKALEENINKLISGEIDVVIEDPHVFHYFFTSRDRRDSPADFQEMVAPGQPEFIYIAFSPVHPKSEEYAMTLSEGVGELRFSGKLADILKKYGISDWME